MEIVTGDRYLEYLVKFVDRNAGTLLDGTLTLKLNPVGLHYVQSRLEALQELEGLLAGAPVDYLRAYVSDLGDHRALEHLRRILGLLTSLKVISVLPPLARDPTPLSLQAFGGLRVLELRGCDLSTSSPRGLLQLSHTLEKLICHNSTDALRHVFASRIADIKVSPMWMRLTFVSCAQNKLVLMDESLQLLPSVKTLDLSRNQFAKVDNLFKSPKLQHLDLGFNHLRSIACLSEVSCPIVKLVLRNNALTTLRGIENLKSVEGLDLSYNLISSFSEMEILANLPCLQNLWLEGNPICYARWYRAYVYSFFSHPERLILDDNSISTKEYWERHIIFTSRQKQPPAYGFYIPAKDTIEEDTSAPANRKKYSRLASIEDEGQRQQLCMESIEKDSCDSDMFMKDESAITDHDPKIIGLINKVEDLKKERSVLWLRDLKDWMDQSSEIMIDRNHPIDFNLHINSEQSRVALIDTKHFGEGFHSADNMKQVAGGGGISNIVFCDSNISKLDKEGRTVLESSAANDGDYFEAGLRSHEICLEQDQMKDLSRNLEGLSPLVVNDNSSVSSSAVGGREYSELPINPARLTAIDEIIGSHSSSTFPGSPPHYQEDILHRRLYLEEEFLQLSAESRSVELSDSDTSCSDDESCGFSMSMSENDNTCIQDSPAESSNHIANHANNKLENGHEESHFMNGNTPVCRHHAKLFSSKEASSLNNNHVDAASCCTSQRLTEDVGGIERMHCKQQLKRGFVSLIGNLLSCNSQPECERVNGTLNTHSIYMKDKQGQSSSCANDFDSGKINAKVMQLKHEAEIVPASIFDKQEQNEYVKDFFNSKVADSKASETCQQIVFCGCIYQHESDSHESEVALLRSCKNKLYLLLIDQTDGLGTVSRVLGCYGLNEIREVVTGLGLLTLRINMERDMAYLLLTKTIEISKNLFVLLQIYDSSTSTAKCCLKSWEQVQLDLFEKYISGNLRTGIYFYSVILFWQDKFEGKLWMSRSLFMIEGYIIVCTENFKQFGFETDCHGTPPYYSFESLCPIQNILEVVIESEEGGRCLTLIAENVPSENIFLGDRKTCTGQERSCKWKLKWFSEDYLFKFVSLLKAMYSGASASTLHVFGGKFISRGQLPAEQLSMICTSAVKEAVSNIYGDKLDSFTRSFEKSFDSTLKTLLVIDKVSSSNHGNRLRVERTLNVENDNLIFESFKHDQGSSSCNSLRSSSCDEHIREPETLSSTNQIALLSESNQHLVHSSRNMITPGFNATIMTTYEKSVIEQIRSNDLKEVELGLTMRKLQMKQSQLDMSSYANWLEKVKICMNVSKAAFKEEKLRNQILDSRHAELIRRCIDLLISGLILMCASLIYAVSIFSYQRITDAMTSCTSVPKESKSWWMPKQVASVSSGWQQLRCHAVAISRLLFGVLMILAISYSLLQRSVLSGSTMPVTSILFLLGIACGIAGKLCVDSLGGSGYHWLIYWETLCLVHLFANLFPSVLYRLLYGRVLLAQGKKHVRNWYWIRKYTFFGILLLVLPVMAGLLPFATIGVWKDHLIEKFMILIPSIERKKLIEGLV